VNPFKPLTRILAIVGKELVSILRRPGALLSLVFGPFLIMAIFGAGYSGFRRPLDTIVVLPADAGMPMDTKSYQDIAGEGLRITLVTSDEAAAMDQLNHQVVDVVVVAPSDLQATFEAGHRSQIQVRVNATDPVASSYDTFLARGLEAEPPKFGGDVCGGLERTFAAGFTAHQGVGSDQIETLAQIGRGDGGLRDPDRHTERGTDGLRRAGPPRRGR